MVGRTAFTLARQSNDSQAFLHHAFSQIPQYLPPTWRDAPRFEPGFTSGQRPAPAPLSPRRPRQLGQQPARWRPQSVVQ